MAPLTNSIPTRELGTTGERVSMIGLGGFHLSKPSEAEAIRIVHGALDGGITFLDNCWDYANGASEERMGKALAGGRRDEAFLMTKVDGRTRASARKQLEESLHRLGTDHVDLWQFHEVIRFEDAENLFALGGVEAAVEARDAGLVRFIGFTGHKDPEIHLHMLEVAERNGFRFDAVQMPLNVMDAHYRSFQRRVLPVLQERGIGVLGMKPLGDGTILESGVAEARDCLRYALSLPTDVVITGCDSLERLQQAIAVGTGFSAMTDDEMQELLERTASLASDGRYERYKTSATHDGTAGSPEWLGLSEDS